MSQATGSEANSELRIFLWVALTFACICGIGGWFAYTALNGPAKTAGIPPDRPRELVAFALTDQTGRPVTQATLAGKFLVVSFLEASCSLTCREVSRHMAEVQQLTANQPDVRLVSLSVDTRTDTVPVLAGYGARFGANTNRWFLLTGDKAVLYALIARSFLNQEANDPFNSMPGNFSHTERIALVDADGRVRSYFDGLRGDTAKAVVAEIARLRK